MNERLENQRFWIQNEAGYYNMANRALRGFKPLEKAASGFVYTSGGAYEIGSVASDWNMLKGIYRKTWQSKTHFVAVSKLDGVMRGPASTNLWKLDSKVEGFLEYHYG